MPKHRAGDDGEKRAEAQHVGHPPDLVPTGQVARPVNELRERVADHRPPLVLGAAFQGDAVRLGPEAGDPDGGQHAQDDRVLRTALDADPVRPPASGPVSAHDGDRHPGEEADAGEVADQCIAPVHVAVEELQALGNLVVDLQHRRHREQDEEVEVDQRVHDPRPGLPHEGLHVHAGAEVGEAVLQVLRCGRPPIGCAPLPVLHPVRQLERTPDQQDRHHRVERQPEHRWDVLENLALHGRVVVELERRGCHPGQHGDHGDQQADPEPELACFQARRYVFDGVRSVGRFTVHRWSIHTLRQGSGEFGHAADFRFSGPRRC